jgi:methionine-rich copper-binding protein CopC
MNGANFSTKGRFFIDLVNKEDVLSKTDSLSLWCRKALVVAIILTFTQGALANVNLLDSFPKQGAKMGESVTDLRLWFDSEPDAERSEVVLLHKGARIPVVALHSMGEKDLMGFVQEQTPPGKYQVIWRVVTDEGATITRGQIEFEIVESGSAP